MRQRIKQICVLVILMGVLVTNMSVEATELSSPNIEAHALNDGLPYPFFGTWRNPDRSSQVYVFREDGTGLVGSWVRYNDIRWYIQGGEITTTSSVGSRRHFLYSFEGSTLAVSSPPGSGSRFSATFTFYSEATDLYEENLFLVQFVFFPIIVLIVLCLIWRKISKRRREQHLR